MIFNVFHVLYCYYYEIRTNFEVDTELWYAFTANKLHDLVNDVVLWQFDLEISPWVAH